MLQGQRDLAAVSSMILSELAPLVSAQHAVFYSMNQASEGVEPLLELQASYGFQERRNLSTSFRIGEGLIGQCAKEKERILLSDVPNDYVQINAHASTAALNIIVLPILFEGSVRAVIELASSSPFSEAHQAFLDQLPESIGLVLNTIEADTLTENLLKQSQSQAEELRSQQEELRESNEDLGRQASLLAEQNIEAEKKNQEVEQSKRLVEEKAGQLAVSSKYKSEFIANMSHELRTPLNSLLILAEQLQDDPEHTMSDTQIEYAGVILNSGKDLLSLLNSILDLAKVEAGAAHTEMTDVPIAELRADLLHEFGPVARDKRLGYSIDLRPGSPTSITTDRQRLYQILKNLLANAFKFTDDGDVHVVISSAENGWTPDSKSLVHAPSVIAFAVSDTGIGIGAEHHQRIFEAFAQGDGTTTGANGGTGLGLSISRELAGLLGGEITLASTPELGSTFTVYLPLSGSTTTPPTTTPPTAPPPATTPPVLDAPPLVLPSNGRAAATNGVSAAPPATPRTAIVPAAPSFPAPRLGSGLHRLDGAVLDGIKVLVVDDDYRNTFALTALLERAHADVRTAESGPDAIDSLERNPGVDVILMDIMMPVMDGYTAIRTIRADPRFNSIPIVAVTGKVVTGERERCLGAGANDYVPKPVNTAELLNAITPWLPGDAPSIS
jgi:signal transduction histidine kinase/CheY-like chemotaxis protein